MMNYRHYTYRVIWSADDEEYVALCTEFPSISYLAPTHHKALDGILNLVKDIVEDMAANDEDIPEPIMEKSYSGKFQVRIPPEQHKMLAIKAAEEGISLNRLVSSKLTP